MDKTVSDYINDISECKSNLAIALVAKGAQVSTDDTFRMLVQKVEGLHAGVTYGSCTLTASSVAITLNNIPFLPTRIGIVSKELLLGAAAGNLPYVVMCNYENNVGEVYDSDENITNQVLNVNVVKKTDSSSGKLLFDVTVSVTDSLVFMAYREYTWVACSEGFEFL